MSAQAAAPGSGHRSIEAVGRQLAGAVLSLRAAMEMLAGLQLDAAAGATMLGLLEQAHRSVAFGQLLATFQCEVSQVNRLDPDTARRIDRLAANPEALTNGTAHVPAEVLHQGMAPQRNTQAYLQAHLHISHAEARRRLAGARLLIAPAPPNPDDAAPVSGPGEPKYPILAEAAADGSADVATLAQLAGRLDSMAPRISPRPDAKQVATAIEESLSNEARTGGPQACHKALQDWKDFLSDHGSAITDEEILARRGLFYRGFHDGCDEFLLRCDPIDSEVIRSFGEAWSNPRSQKSPPRSASTQPRTMSTPSAPAPAKPTSVKSTSVNPDSGKPGIPPVPGAAPLPGSTGVPLGTPIPEWAVAPGTPADLIPVNQLECGAPHPGFSIGTVAMSSDGDENSADAQTDASAQQDSPGSIGPYPGTGQAADDERTTPQLLLDALTGACAGVMEGKNLSQTGGLRVRVGVTIDYRTLLGQLEEAGMTDHGRPVSALRIRAMACTGGLLPVVLGSKGEVLDMGREVRGFTTAQHKALAIRDRGCVVPGCHRPAATSEAHHVWSWLDGGPTNVGNGCIVCQYHHLMVHAGLITLHMIEGIPYVMARAGEPRGDP
ncbi:HNH endonuclease signature motif containing protein [Paeniglutamicibacter kerguelensis]|uniref:DUF222 domain-containing protein n=1 Tax=Paeniglutamicibacter kerguelensis TaxID=254788 RepID=A0ABS4XEY0_9MICC|nr:HNH endonuclease signature motif containing protein [Paeniglutamicibacter kerguelensis]MBP2386813.1 hypothetical protein [Paeniglutamicibacter kerguelensis]